MAHTPRGECTSDCRKIGCPDSEENLSEPTQNNSQSMQDPKQDWKERFDSRWKIECSSHERTSSSKCICPELSDINEEYEDIKAFIESLLVEEKVRVLEEVKLKFSGIKVLDPEKSPPKNNLSQNQIFMAGQMNAMLRVKEMLEALKGK